MSESNDEQLQEFEEKLESLGQRLEDLEFKSNNLDPFDWYDVERMLEDFRIKEQGVDVEVEGQGSEAIENNDFIQVNSVSKKHPKFEAHWIGIDECGTYTSCDQILSATEAKAALLNAIAYRKQTTGKRRVKHGDVLLLLCRNTGELPSGAPEGSEPPAKSCTYIGMYTEYGFAQDSEPDANSGEAKISGSNSFGDVFVWSSCSDGVVDCEEELTKVEVLTSGASSTTSSGSSVEQDLEFVTDVTVEKDAVESGYTERGIVLDSNLEQKVAGFYGGFKSLSTKLTNWWVDYHKQKFNLSADAGTFSSTTTTKTLSSDFCGNLLLEDSDSSGSENQVDLDFNKNFQVSLGNLALVDVSELDNSLAIPTYELDFGGLSQSKIFLPRLTEFKAELIDESAFISYLESYEITIEAKYTVVYESENKGDAEYYFYKKEKKVNAHAFASGLFYGGGDEDPDGTEKVLLGIIPVKNVPLKYSCDPLYGCMIDPAGEYYEDTCGGNCEYYNFTPSGSSGTLWLWDAMYASIGPEDNSDLSEEDWNYDDTLQYREDYTHLIYNGKRYKLEPHNSGQFEFEWHSNVNGSTQYLGGNVGQFSGSLPFEDVTSSGDLWRRVTTSRPVGYPAIYPSKDTLTGEIIDEEDFIEFNI